MSMKSKEPTFIKLVRLYLTLKNKIGKRNSFRPSIRITVGADLRTPSKPSKNGKKRWTNIWALSEAAA